VVDLVNIEINKGVKSLVYWDPTEQERQLLFYMIVGFIRPNEGKVFLDNQEITPFYV